MDSIKVGLDFGTHQTKICVRTAPDEGHGQPIYEFFKFKDLEGKSQYFLPSKIQINEDDTLSYGYTDPNREKINEPKPSFNPNCYSSTTIDIDNTVNELYNKYASTGNTEEDKAILKEMLGIRVSILKEKQKKQEAIAREQYETQLQEYENNRNVFRYFKQATFSEREWKKKIDYKTLSIWYLSYIIFLLEQKYGTNFSINMGIPTDDKRYEHKKELAVEILLSAYHLVETVYQNDMSSFLAEKINTLLKKTEYIRYSLDEKKEYIINIFPEAYAGLITLTSRGKLSNGMSLIVDIGGGTTDISFFNIDKSKPMIYRYWSIPRGLNYIAEKSGFDYFESNDLGQANEEVIQRFNQKKLEIVSNLISELHRQFVDSTNLFKGKLYAALKDRVLVYTGGGSTIPFLINPISDFKDVIRIDAKMWKEENVKEKSSINQLCHLLTTSYGLSMGEDDNEVILSPISTFFGHIPKEKKKENQMIDKDYC